MHRFTIILAIYPLCSAGAGTAQAATPTLGGPMSHLLVTVFNQQVFLSFESPSMSTVEMQDNAGDFTGPASVLNGMGYNAQFGWLANGFISIPPDSSIYIRTIAGSPHLNIYEETSFAPILGTEGSADTWRWDGTMAHNWYSTETHGEHFIRHEVFVGDESGNPLDGYTSATIDLRFFYGPDLSGRVRPFLGPVTSTIPAPGTLAGLTAVAMLATRRRRSGS